MFVKLKKAISSIVSKNNAEQVSNDSKCVYGNELLCQNSNYAANDAVCATNDTLICQQPTGVVRNDNVAAIGSGIGVINSGICERH